VATAQVEVWVSACKGSIEQVGRSVDTTLMDAAIGRMMLYRRRAVVASIIDEFFRRTGSRFLPYLEGGVPSAPTCPADELAIAIRAGNVVAGGAPPALLFERALLAEGDGRLGDAQTDLQRVLADYPGFVPAAIAAGRVALATSAPGLVIRSLAAVEREIVHTREGSGVLGDALRQIGMHEAASHYDLAMLTCRGGYDSRGNDCIPVDASGKIANDDRMPQIFYFESQPDGAIICNGRGVYYRMNSLLSRAALAVVQGQTVAGFRSLGVGQNPAQTHVLRERFNAAVARAMLLLHDYPVLAIGARLLRRISVPLRRLFRRIRVAALVAFLEIVPRVAVFASRTYRRLPVPMRLRANRYLLNEMRIQLARRRFAIAPLLVRAKEAGLSEITGQGARGLARTRYESGIARIFGVQMSAAGGVVGHQGGPFQPTAQSGQIAAPATASGPQSPEAAALPPLAEEVLRGLLADARAGVHRSPSPLP
jgi:hypothetical protein